MQFDYLRRDWIRGTIYVPVLPVSLNGFPVGFALVDTGADATILPMEINEVLRLELDPAHAIQFTNAGGTEFRGIPPKKQIEFSLEQAGSHIEWKGTAFFAKNQPMILFGQHECLSELRITLDGKRRKVVID